jgi:hypothetical protein
MLSKLKPLSIEDMWIWVFGLGLLFTREISLTRYLGLESISNFTDVIISPAVFILFFYTICSSKRLQMKWLIIGAVVLNLTISYWFSGFENWFWFVQTWLIIIGYLLVDRSLFQKLWLPLIFVAMFDHVLISSIYPVVALLFVQTVNKTKVRSNWIYLPIFINGFVGLYQTIAGKSLGLYLMGEKYLALTGITGVAKTNIGDQVFLRGYGLFPHPIVLGVVSMIMVLGIEKKGDQNLKSKLVFGISLLSQSRAVLLGYIINAFKKINYVYLLLVLPLVLLFGVRINSSDIYRNQDIKNYIAFVATNPNKLLIGVGAGQYATDLQGLEGLQKFQYQPVHNLFLQIIIELGVLPLLVLVIVLSRIVQKQALPKN